MAGAVGVGRVCRGGVPHLDQSSRKRAVSHRYHLAGSHALRVLFLALVEEASTTSADPVAHVFTRAHCEGPSRLSQKATATNPVLVCCTETDTPC